MNRLIDAFLELPTWQGVALIAVLVAIQTALCLIVLAIGTRQPLIRSTSQPLNSR